MSSAARSCSIRLIERLFDEGVVAGLSDAELVKRFATARDADVFAAIVARHGPIVMAVCRGLLGSSGDADDAFQATFLVFMKRAGTFPVGPSLGGWLYRVARRVAQVRQADARRRRRELAACSRAEATLDYRSEQSEIIQVIHDEIDRLPERYRSPILLCDLQGLTRDEAAGLLGWPAGTVGGRLARARRQLRDRLERRGLAPSVALPILARAVLPASAWQVSLDASIRRTSALALGNAATTAAQGLAARTCRLFVGGSVKTAIFAGLGFAIVGLAAARSTLAPQTAPAAIPTTGPSKPAGVPDPDDPKLAGHFAGRVIGTDGQSVRGARLFIAPNDPRPTEAGLVRAISGADGRFEFDAPDMTHAGIDGLPTRRQGLLIATADQYQPDWVVTWGQVLMPLHLRSDPVKGAELTLRLARFDVPIHGRLLDQENQPLAGAHVLVSSIKVPREGKFDADLKTFDGAKGRAWPFNYDQSLGAPNVLPGVETEAITDALGRFRISGLGRDRLVELKVTAPSVVETYLTVMTRDAPDLAFDPDSDGYPRRAILGAGFTSRLKPGRTIRGIVRDRETRAPIPGMWVVAGNAIGVFRTNRSDFSSDSNGRYAISGIDPAIRDLEVTAVPRPGQPYLMAKAKVGERSGAMIDCLRSIPFRLKLVDEAGQPVVADVEYRPVMPNPHAVSLLPHEWSDGTAPLNRAVMTSRGTYEGFAIPGPGAVMVKMPDRSHYRPARVDPKAFFAPGRTDWTNQELITAYGTQDTLIIGYAWVDQHDYAAIVLLDPPVVAKPLELSATVFPDKPRQVTILDPDGQPVVGVKPDGLTGFPWDYEPPLRAATFPITKLHPDRSRRITFLKEDRKLIGFLLARGDSEKPYTVRLQPWATVTGRVVDENGDPFPPLGEQARENEPAFVLTSDGRHELATRDDPQVGWCRDANPDRDGRFRIERLIPGLRYSTVIYRGAGMFAGVAFENIVLKPGETRDLGDIRSKTPVDVRGK